MALTDSATLTNDQCGIVTQGGTGKTITLPAVKEGAFFLIINLVDQTNTVATAANNEYIVFNDATGGTQALSTASNKAGQAILVIGTATFWQGAVIGWVKALTGNSQGIHAAT